MWWWGPAAFLWPLSWIVLLAAVVFGGLLMRRGRWAGPWRPAPDAAEILRGRLAGGELSEAEYLRLREILSR